MIFAQMQNEKCRMLNEGILFGDDFEIVAFGDTAILHFAFSILHL